MKKQFKTYLNVFLALAAIWTLVGCPPDGGGGTTRYPPTDIVVKDSSGTEMTSLTLAVDETAELTVSATGGTEYWWEVIGGEGVELSDEEGATTTVTAKTVGTNTKIKVYAGNKDGSISKEIPVTVQDEVLQLQITKVMADGNEISATGKITLPVGDSAALTFEVKDEKGAAVTGATIQVTSNAVAIATISTTSGIKVNGETVGETAITITAEKQGYKRSESVTRSVSVVSSDTPILSLTVGSESTGTWEGDTLTIKDNDTLTLSAAGTVSGEDVTLTSVEWEVTGTEGIVEVGETTGVVTVTKPGTTQIKVTAQAAEAEEPAAKTITLVVKSSAELLFEWQYTTNPWTANLTSGNSLKLPSTTYENFFNQGTTEAPKYVSTIMNLGANIVIDSTYGGIRSPTSNNPRVSIGKSNNAQTNDTWNLDTVTGGEINLYRKKVRFTLDYADPVSTASNYLLRIYVFNTHTGGNFGPFPAASDAPCNIVTYDDNAALIAASTYDETAKKGTLVLEIDTRTADGAEDTGYGKNLYGHENERELGEAFFTLHTQTQSALTITGIKIELLADAQVGDVPPRVSRADLTIKDSEGKEVVTLSMEIGDEANLTAVTESGATVTWTSDKTDIAAVTPSGDNTTAVIDAIAAGAAAITVTASHPNFRPNTVVFNVTVKEPDAVFNPLIFDWNRAVNGGLSSGTALNGTSQKITGSTSALYSEVRVRGSSADVAMDNAANGNGITIPSAASRLAIGHIDNATPSDFSTNGGDFDFSAATADGKKIKISFYGKILVAGSTGSYIRIILNRSVNNGPSPADYEIAAFGGATQITKDTERWFETTFDPADTKFSALQGELAKAFFLITCQGGTAGSSTYSVLVTQIKIEYVDP
jgi:uncharacterized cupredoxin-like copper-binding protein